MKLEYILIILALISVSSLLYTIIKEKETHRKIRTLAKSVGELSRQFYESEMRFNDKLKHMGTLKSGLSEVDIETLIDVGISEKLIVINQTSHSLQQDMQAFGEEFAGRIVRIENNLKESSLSRANVGGADDQKILGMFKDGITVEEIAKDLRISTPEVEFALKLADLR